MINCKKSDSEYKIVPVLLVAGHQINDSFLMVKQLAPLLDAKLSDEDVAFEKQMTYGFQSACLSNILENGWNMRNMVNKGFGCAAANCLTFCCCNCACGRAFMRNKKKKGGDKNTAVSVWQYLEIIDEKLGENNFLQGDEAHILDVSLYGMTYSFAANPTMGFFQELLDKSEKFSRWWIRMNEIVGKVN